MGADLEQVDGFSIELYLYVDHIQERKTVIKQVVTDFLSFDFHYLSVLLRH